MTQEEKVLKYLKQHGSITSLEMFKMFYICCPQGVIRNLRKTYDITDEYVVKKRKETDADGKSKQVCIRFKKYMLNNL
jgi:hypothetical protein